LLVNGFKIISNIIVSPEKDHPAQLRAFAQLLNRFPQHTEKGEAKDPVKLILIGGSRNDEDARRVADLRRLAKELEVEVRSPSFST
jgi:alpha-1,2-mannosyltransferase